MSLFMFMSLLTIVSVFKFVCVPLLIGGFHLVGSCNIAAKASFSCQYIYFVYVYILVFVHVFVFVLICLFGFMFVCAWEIFTSLGHATIIAGKAPGRLAGWRYASTGFPPPSNS